MVKVKRERRPAKVGRPSRYRDLRQTLIRAGLAIIARGGPRALTLRAVGRRTGVSQTAPYLHFADKRALLAAIAEEGFRAMAEEMRRAAAVRAADPLGCLHALGQAYVDFARAHSAHFRVMFGHEVGDNAAHPGLQAATSEALEPLRATVADCQRAGLMVSGDREVMAGRLWAAIHGVAALLVDGKLRGQAAEDPEAFVDGITAMMGLGFVPREPLSRSRTCADRPPPDEGEHLVGHTLEGLHPG